MLKYQEKIYYLLILMTLFLYNVLSDFPIYLPIVVTVCGIMGIFLKTYLPQKHSWVLLMFLAMIGILNQYDQSIYLGLNLLSCYLSVDLLKKPYKKQISTSASIVLLTISFLHPLCFRSWHEIMIWFVFIMTIAQLYFCFGGRALPNFKRMVTLLVKASAFVAILLLTANLILPILFSDYLNLNKGGAKVGFTRSLDPGRIASLSQDSSQAFKAYLTEGIDLKGPSYWRGTSLSIGRGLKWRESSIDKYNPLESFKGKTNIIIMQEKSVGKTLFSPFRILGVSYDGEEGLVLGQDESYSLNRYPKDRFQYEVFTNLNDSQDMPTDQPKPIHLQLPKNLSPMLISVFHSLKRRSTDAKDFTLKLLNWFKEENFVYTLKPGSKSSNLDSFLAYKKGFCSHYAATVATILRMNQIPSRVVVGYHGGEFNSFERSISIRNSDAHAWVEAFFPNEKHWTLLDPTKVLALERLQQGGQRYHWYWNKILGFTVTDRLWSIKQELTQALTAYYFELIICAAVLIALLIYIFLTKTDSSDYSYLSKQLDQSFLFLTKKIGHLRKPYETETEYLRRVTGLDREYVLLIEEYIKTKYGKADLDRNKVLQFSYRVRKVKRRLSSKPT